VSRPRGPGRRPRSACERLTAFLLRHARVYREGSAWTGRHERWLAVQRFHERAMDLTYGHYRAVLAAREAALGAIEADLEPWFHRDPFAGAVQRLAAYRGVAQLGALTLASEVCDWRRFGRATAFMGFVGLVPSEYSSGDSICRSHLTKARCERSRNSLALPSRISLFRRAGCCVSGGVGSFLAAGVQESVEVVA
jgi:transposase